MPTRPKTHSSGRTARTTATHTAARAWLYLLDAEVKLYRFGSITFPAHCSLLYLAHPDNIQPQLTAIGEGQDSDDLRQVILQTITGDVSQTIASRAESSKDLFGELHIALCNENSAEYNKQLKRAPCLTDASFRELAQFTKHHRFRYKMALKGINLPGVDVDHIVNYTAVLGRVVQWYKEQCRQSTALLLAEFSGSGDSENLGSSSSSLPADTEVVSRDGETLRRAAQAPAAPPSPSPSPTRTHGPAEMAIAQYARCDITSITTHSPSPAEPLALVPFTTTAVTVANTALTFTLSKRIQVEIHKAHELDSSYTAFLQGLPDQPPGKRLRSSGNPCTTLATMDDAFSFTEKEANQAVSGDVTRGTAWNTIKILGAAPPQLRLIDGSTLIDIGSGYGGFLFHAAARRPEVRFTGIEIKKAVYEESKRILRDLQEDGYEIDNVDIHHGTFDMLEKKIGTDYSHVYAFDYCFDDQTTQLGTSKIERLADALRRIPFKIFCSSKSIAFWEEYDLFLATVPFAPSIQKEVEKAKYTISGSGESHRMYFYRKITLPSPSASVSTDPLEDLVTLVDQKLYGLSKEDRSRFLHRMAARHLLFTQPPL